MKFRRWATRSSPRRSSRSEVPRRSSRRAWYSRRGASARERDEAAILDDRRAPRARQRQRRARAGGGAGRVRVRRRGQDAQRARARPLRAARRGAPDDQRAVAAARRRAHRVRRRRPAAPRPPRPARPFAARADPGDRGARAARGRGAERSLGVRAGHSSRVLRATRRGDREAARGGARRVAAGARARSRRLEAPDDVGADVTRADRRRARDHAAAAGTGPQGARRRRTQASGARDARGGRDKELGERSRALDNRRRRSVLLVGDEAAGKSALVLAWAAANPQRELWATSASELIAGASGLGEWQARVANVLAAAEALDAILYFDDYGALFADKPAEGGIDLGAAMRRHVVDGRVRIVGELTAVALDRAERHDVSLIGAMLRVQVAPTDPPTTIAACQAWAAQWKKTQPHRPQIDAAMVPTAVDLARRYLPSRAYPGKAVRLLEELRVAHDQARDDKGAGKLLGESELYAAFSWATGVPIALLDDKRAIAQQDVIASLRTRMIG